MAALLSARDLGAYATDTNDPLWGSYRGRRLATNRPPGGGVMLVEMLNILENFDLVAMGHNSPAYIRTVAEAMKIATVDKDRHVGDPRFTEVPLERLTDKAYARDHSRSIEAGKKAHVERMPLGEAPGTTHLVTADHEGNIVTMTHTLGMMSGVITEGLGFMYNGAMAVFDPRPGRTGRSRRARHASPRCVPPSCSKAAVPSWRWAPQEERRSHGCAAGHSQRDRIRHGPAGSHPGAPLLGDQRHHHRDGAIPRYLCAELEAEGYRVERSPFSYDIASVHAIGFDSEGHPSGGADIPYGDGMALAV